MSIIEGYLLETSIASTAWDKGSRRHTYVRERLEQLGDALVYVSAVSIAEVEYGLKVAPETDATRQADARSAMGSYEILGIDRHTAYTYAEIRSVLFKTYSPRDRRGRLTQKRIEDLVERTSGKELGIQENDLWNASVAVQYNLIFVTNDRMQRVIQAAQYSHRTEYW